MFLVLLSSPLPFWSPLPPSHSSPLPAYDLLVQAALSFQLPPTRAAVPVWSYAFTLPLLSSLAPPPLPPFSSPSHLQRYNRQPILCTDDSSNIPITITKQKFKPLLTHLMHCGNRYTQQLGGFMWGLIKSKLELYIEGVPWSPPMFTFGLNPVMLNISFQN